MGAAVSSNTALKQAISSSVGEYGLPRNPKRWKVSHVSTWLQQNDMGVLVPVMEEHGVDGQLLVQDFEDDDFKEIVKFAPLRRKLIRHVALLRQRASEDLVEEYPFAPEDLHRGLQQLNKTMESLVTVLSAERGPAPPKEEVRGGTGEPAKVAEAESPPQKESDTSAKPVKQGSMKEAISAKETKPNQPGNRVQSSPKEADIQVNKAASGDKRNDEPQIQAVIEVISAEHLPKQDVLGKADPYCVVKVDGREAGGEKQGRTAVVSKSLAPEWAAAIPATLTPSSKVTLEVYDADVGTGDDWTGVAAVGAEEVAALWQADMPAPVIAPLTDKPGGKQVIGNDKQPATIKFRMTATGRPVAKAEEAKPQAEEAKASEKQQVQGAAGPAEAKRDSKTEDVKATQAGAEGVEGRAEENPGLIADGGGEKRRDESSGGGTETNKGEAAQGVSATNAPAVPSAGAAKEGAEAKPAAENPEIQAVIEVISAEHLPKQDVLGKADPYCVVKVDGREAGGEKQGRTAVVSKSLAPEWAAAIPATLTPSSKVTLEVYDADAGTGDDWTGVAAVGGEEVAALWRADMPAPVIAPLTDKPGGKQVIGHDKQPATIKFRMTATGRPVAKTEEAKPPVEGGQSLVDGGKGPGEGGKGDKVTGGEGGEGKAGERGGSEEQSKATAGGKEGKGGKEGGKGEASGEAKVLGVGQGEGGGGKGGEGGGGQVQEVKPAEGGGQKEGGEEGGREEGTKEGEQSTGAKEEETKKGGTGGEKGHSEATAEGKGPAGEAAEAAAVAAGNGAQGDGVHAGGKEASAGGPGGNEGAEKKGEGGEEGGKVADGAKVVPGAESKAGAGEKPRAESATPGPGGEDKAGAAGTEGQDEEVAGAVAGGAKGETPPTAATAATTAAQPPPAGKQEEPTAAAENPEITATFEIISADHLQKQDNMLMGGKADPYCVLKVDGREVGRTPHVKNSLAATWNNAFTTKIKKDAMVTLDVMDYDSATASDFLGTFGFVFNAFTTGKQTVKLLDKDGKKTVVGKDGQESTLTFQVNTS